MNQAPKKPREITVSRRLFIVGTIVGGTAAGIGIVSSPQVQSFLFEKLGRRPLSQRVADEATSNRRSAIWTCLETAVTFVANIAIGYVIDHFGVDHGGHAADGDLYAEQLEAAPLSLYVRDNFAIPTVEEAIFRLMPSAFFSEETAPNLKMHWGTGLTSAAFFAAIHNFSKPEEDKITLHLDSLPVEQFVLGTYCWYAQRKGGFGHAVGAHILYNNLCEAYWHLYEKKVYENQIIAAAEAENARAAEETMSSADAKPKKKKKKPDPKPRSKRKRDGDDDRQR